MTDEVQETGLMPMPVMSKQVSAFCDLIGTSEGTIYSGDQGYNVLFGSTPAQPLTFPSYADHPRILRKALIKGKDSPAGRIVASTAAGKFQELAHVFDVYKVQLHLWDFGPGAQTTIALQMLRETRALPLIEAGQITAAIYAASSRWASFPGNQYDQHAKPLDWLLKAYRQLGGNVTA